MRAAIATADIAAAGMTSREAFATYSLFTGTIGADEKTIIENAAPILSECGQAARVAEIMELIDKYGEKKAVGMRL